MTGLTVDGGGGRQQSRHEGMLMTPAMASGTATLTSRPEVPWLSGVSVRAVGRSVTLDVAVRVLSQLGASVLAEDDVARVDIVLADRIGGPGDGAESAADYVARVQEANTAVWVTASAYGLSSSRADAFASELTLLAAGGILGHSRIGDEWAPTVPPGDLALKLVGYSMAVAALHAVHAWRATGTPVHVDLSAQEAVIATGLTLEMAHALSGCPDEGGSARYGAPSGFFDCLDGSVYVLVLEQHQWEAFRGALAPALDDIDTLVAAREHSDLVNEQLRSWTARRTAEECERLLQGAGVPCTEVNTLDLLVQRAQAVGRPLDLTSAEAPPLPALIQTRTHDDATSRRRPTTSISQLRVLDAGHVLAVPLGAAWLGAMGAEVTKLEDPQRLDVYRRRGPFADGKPGLNRSAYFNQLNFCKVPRDTTIADGVSDLDLEPFEVVLHNLTPRRASVVGVSIDDVLDQRGPKLAIASSGFGGAGAWANYRAYGHNIHAFAGLVAATRDGRGEMGDMGTPWADPLTSVAIAAWVLAWSLAPEHDVSVGIDISMAELTAVQLTSLHGQDVDAVYTPAPGEAHFFLRIEDQLAMTAVSTRSGAELATVENLLGQSLPALGTVGQLVTVRGFEIEGGEASAATIADELLARGIPASVVLTADELARDPFVRSTGLYQAVESADRGGYEVTGLPWRFVGEPRIGVSPAPERPVED